MRHDARGAVNLWEKCEFSLNYRQKLIKIQSTLSGDKIEGGDVAARLFMSERHWRQRVELSNRSAAAP